MTTSVPSTPPTAMDKSTTSPAANGSPASITLNILNEAFSNFPWAGAPRAAPGRPWRGSTSGAVDRGPPPPPPPLPPSSHYHAPSAPWATLAHAPTTGTACPPEASFHGQSFGIQAQAHPGPAPSHGYAPGGAPMGVFYPPTSCSQIPQQQCFAPQAPPLVGLPAQHPQPQIPQWFAPQPGPEQPFMSPQQPLGPQAPLHYGYYPQQARPDTRPPRQPPQAMSAPSMPAHYNLQPQQPQQPRVNISLTNHWPPPASGVPQVHYYPPQGYAQQYAPQGFFPEHHVAQPAQPFAQWAQPPSVPPAAQACGKRDSVASETSSADGSETGSDDHSAPGCDHAAPGYQRQNGARLARVDETQAPASGNTPHQGDAPPARGRSPTPRKLGPTAPPRPPPPPPPPAGAGDHTAPPVGQAATTGAAGQGKARTCGGGARVSSAQRVAATSGLSYRMPHGAVDVPS